ncbi:MAG TPA: histidine--tRNA ligase, partial [Kofleriaceae bacterium]|nr:histidine--tRNA ligase [Kofleriaceae bacterium]
MASFDLSPPSGTRDFLPDEVIARDRVIRTIKDVFERYGFGPLETPAFERIEILTGKYGDEGDKLIFKILKRGEQAATGEADYALRYDLTVPLARVVANNRHKLGAIWKRYHIAPVWRADRPAKGRFREFYQCDIDVVGAKGPIADAEVLLAMSEALVACKLETFTIKLNSRKVLRGLLEAYAIAPEHQKLTLIELDKLDKEEVPAILARLEAAGVSERSRALLQEDLATKDTAKIRARVATVPLGAEGLREVDTLAELVGTPNIVFEPFLARGLDYYTGCVFEFGAPGLGSSIASGGRYDELVGMFSNRRVPACGGSLGIERILMLLEEREEATQASTARVLVTIFDKESRVRALRTARRLREAGIATEVFVGDGELGKQLKYAASRSIPLATIVGPDEVAKQLVTIKDLRVGQQENVPDAELETAIGRL